MPYKSYTHDYSVSKSMKFGEDKQQENQVILQSLLSLTKDPNVPKEDQLFAKDCIDTMVK